MTSGNSDIGLGVYRYVCIGVHGIAKSTRTTVMITVMVIIMIIFILCNSKF